MTTLGWLDAQGGRGGKWEDCKIELQSKLPGTLLSQLGDSPGAVGGLLASLAGIWGPVSSFCRVPLAAMNSRAKLQQEAEVHLFMNDADAMQTKEFNGYWRSFWYAFNLLQFAPRFSATCHTGVAQHRYDPLLVAWPFRENYMPQQPVEPDGWAFVLENSFIDPVSLNQLKNAEIPVPDVGMDLTRGDVTVATAELSWSVNKIAVLVGKVDESVQIPDWLLISTEQENWLTEVIQQLKGDKS
jgi:DEAD/DEAH box helicase domain-containing protein